MLLQVGNMILIELKLLEKKKVSYQVLDEKISDLYFKVIT
jgi:hypothetical protein